jgi:hypothetical protein
MLHGVEQPRTGALVGERLAGPTLRAPVRSQGKNRFCGHELLGTKIFERGLVRDR